MKMISDDELSQREIERLLLAEYQYWREAPDNISLSAIGSMGAISNVLAAMRGHPAPWHDVPPSSGHSNMIWPAAVKVWGFPLLGLGRVRLIMPKGTKTLFHLFLPGISVGISFPAGLVNCMVNLMKRK